MTADVSASSEGTRRFAARFVDKVYPSGAYRPLGRTGLLTSSLGFGTYRVDALNPEHAAALEMALQGGVNLIDTSTNYTDGSSETLIGNVIANHARDEIILVSKVGYVQGQALLLAHDREERDTPFPEMVKYADGCWHCIHPDFLADQLDRSLARLQVDKIDVYLLHNPEYFFSHAVKRNETRWLKTLREEFYDRIRRAFAWLESQVQKGRIGFYGVSSNTFVVPTDHPESTSLEQMWTIAGAIASDHHFAVAQLPANLFESGAALIPNNGGGQQTTLEFARDHDLAVLVNRPLNAFHKERLIRLADTPVENPVISEVLDPFLPGTVRKESLSRKALAVVAHTSGVTCVLNGMRRPVYVVDSLGAMRLPDFAVDPEVYRTFGKL
jgi:aryl-alcohol dehydrogenase-like predicted oxidoreductase